MRLDKLFRLQTQYFDPTRESILVEMKDNREQKILVAFNYKPDPKYARADSYALDDIRLALIHAAKPYGTVVQFSPPIKDARKLEVGILKLQNATLQAWGIDLPLAPLKTFWAAITKH